MDEVLGKDRTTRTVTTHDDMQMHRAPTLMLPTFAKLTRKALVTQRQTLPYM